MTFWSSINWGTVADWVSGIGSLSAAVVALYLARWSASIRLKGYCGFRILVGGGPGPREELVFITVTNIGTRPTRITMLGMRVGFFKKRYAVIPMVKDKYGVGTPFALGDGEDAHWGLPLDAQKTWLREACKDFVKTPSDVSTLVFQIYTSHGYTLNLRPEKPMRDAILAILRE